MTSEIYKHAHAILTEHVKDLTNILTTIKHQTDDSFVHVIVDEIVGEFSQDVSSALGKTILFAKLVMNHHERQNLFTPFNNALFTQLIDISIGALNASSICNSESISNFIKETS